MEQNLATSELSEVLLTARQKYAEEQMQNPPSMVYWRNSLGDIRLRNVFDGIFNKDGTFTSEGKADWERFSKLSFKVDGTVTNYVYSYSQLDLYKFLIFYQAKERKLRIIKKTREFEKRGYTPDVALKKAKERVFRLEPIIIFANVLVDALVNNNETFLGDTSSKLLVIYINKNLGYGKQLAWYASEIKSYTNQKNLMGEQALILSEDEQNDLTSTGAFPIVNLTKKTNGLIETPKDAGVQKTTNGELI